MLSSSDPARGDYGEFKQLLIDRFMDLLETLIPSLRDHLLFCDLGTPLTNVHYINAFRGNLYGTSKTRSQVGPFSFPVRTEISGLYHCGASTVAHGVMGALMSGISAAKEILGCRARDILCHADQGQIQLHETSWRPTDNPAESTEHEMSHT